MATRELRIAPVMTGGTSLAVWMGGASVELYRMLHARTPGAGSDVYRALLDLTDTTPVVDVVTGTSAGGLNGTLLSAALAWGVPLAQFEGIREVWMTQADLARLIRTPAAPGPSLLDGNGTFVPQVQELLQRWYAASPALSAPAAIDLVTTFTALHPRRRLLSDDFRERMDEQVYAGTIRHRFDAEEAPTPPQLAWGARVSASIPGVFEPVYLPTTESSAQAANRVRAASGRGPGPGNSGAAPGPTAYPLPNFGERLRIDGRAVTPGVWAVDGGLVNNLPLGDALDRIFEQGSETEVRRVVLYVSPTPGTVANPGELPGTEPSVVTSVMSVLNAPRAESVGRDVAAIAEHNRAVSRQRAARCAIPQLVHGVCGASGDLPALPDLPESVMATYRRRRAQESVDRTLSRLELVLSSLDDPPNIDRISWRQAWLAARSSPEFLPTRLPTADEVMVGDWQWGISPIELAVSTVLGLFSRTLALPVAPPEPASPLAARVAEARRALLGLKDDVHAVRAELSAWRARDYAYWTTVFDGLVAALATDTLDVREAAYDGYAAWPGAGRDAAMQALWGLMRRVAELLVAAGEPLATLLAGAGVTLRPGVDAPTWRNAREEQDLQTHADAEDIASEYRAVAAVSDVPATVVALLASHIVQVVLLGEVAPREQPVELMQLSWNSPDLLTDRKPEAKIVGNEAARLGAFLLPAWRANDYLWGQLDAAPRLVGMLLDPRRLSQLGLTRSEVREALGVPAPPGPLDAIGHELAYLEPDSTAPIPAALPALVAELARRRQGEIARAGMPQVRAALAETPARGAAWTPAAREFAANYDALVGPSGEVPHEAVGPLLEEMRIGEESLDDYRDSAMFAAYLARLLGTTGTVVRRVDKGPRLLIRFASVALRVVSRLFAIRAWRRRGRSSRAT